MGTEGALRPGATMRWILGQLRSWPARARAAWRLWNHPFVATAAAAIAYRTLFSLAPILVLAIAALGRFVGEAQARRAVMVAVRDGLGVALDGPIQEAVDALLRNIARPEASLRAAVLAGAIVVVGASGVFDEIRLALNHMWSVPHRGGRHGLVRSLAARLAGLAMVLLCGVLVVLSLATALRVEALARRLGATPLAAAFVGGPGHQAAVFVGLLAAFASVYRVFSDQRLRWSAVWGGALIATVLFTAVKAAFAAYVGWASVGSAYGAAGTVIVAVLWVYVSAWVMLLGAAWVGAGVEEGGQLPSNSRET